MLIYQILKFHYQRGIKAIANMKNGLRSDEARLWI